MKTLSSLIAEGYWMTQENRIFIEQTKKQQFVRTTSVSTTKKKRKEKDMTFRFMSEEICKFLII